MERPRRKPGAAPSFACIQSHLVQTLLRVSPVPVSNDTRRPNFDKVVDRQDL
jgi:hypothetical protein